MVQQSSDSNSDGRAIYREAMVGTWRSKNGDTLTIYCSSGNLFISVQEKNANCGCLPETLSLTLQLLKDGSIFGKWDLS
ncbi:hypothetical protein ES703_100170 [subsurface metagenome]